MTFDEFLASLSAPHPPAGLSPALRALWHDARGRWDVAHGEAQEIDDATGAWVHAYLHRKEGDDANAGYWYRRAGQPAETGDLEVEWRAVVRALLDAQPRD